MVKDPVCGRILESESAAGQSEYAGDTYYFCSPDCKGEFDETLLSGLMGKEVTQPQAASPAPGGIPLSLNAIADSIHSPC